VNWKIIHGDVFEVVRSLGDKSVQCCVTSPPYWGLRSYLPDGVVLKADAPASVIDEIEALGIKPVDHTAV